MNQRKVTQKKSFKVLITVICLILVMSLITAGNTSVGNLFTGLIFVPVQQAIAGFLGTAEENLPSAKSLEELEKENQELQEENRKLNDMLAEYYDLKKENEELYQFYDIKKENQDFHLLPASVTGIDPNENFYGFILDKGKNDGVNTNDPVMLRGGLIGRVCEVNEKSCKVSGILSPSVQVGCVDKKTGDTGIITGSASYCDEGFAVMKNISAQNHIQKGDLIVTSGYGGLYPRNVRIGTVKEIITDEYTGNPMAVIKPFEDLRKINSAAIVTAFNGKGEISENSQS